MLRIAQLVATVTLRPGLHTSGLVCYEYGFSFQHEYKDIELNMFAKGDLDIGICWVINTILEGKKGHVI